MNNIAIIVGDDLDLNMTDSLNEALHKKIVASKGFSRLVLTGIHGRAQIHFALHHPYASPASGARRSQHKRISDLLCDRYRFVKRGDTFLGSGLYGYAQLFGERLGGHFITQRC